MSSTVKQIIFWLLIIAGAVLLYTAFKNGTGVRETPLAFTDLMQNVQDKKVKEATFESSQVRGKLTNDQPFVTELENEQVQANLVSEMQKAGTKIDFKTSDGLNLDVFFHQALDIAKQLVLIDAH